MKKNLIYLLLLSFHLIACDVAGVQNPGSGAGSNQSGEQNFIIDHSCTDIYAIPRSAIQEAKEKLHIAYGHTSHGSQITTGMTSLVNFMSAKEGYPANLFSWSRNGTGDTLHLYEGDGYGDGDLDHDCGYFPGWVNETNDYLGTPDNQGRGSNHPEINVIMWAWCGQVNLKTEQTLVTQYLEPMAAFEAKYPGITFVYMTGHAEGTGESGDVHLRNRQIRDFCETKGKVLFDFYDIECYDPDGTYYGDKNVSDDCSYDSDGNGSRDANWALEWQSSHTEGVDWYSCSASHSQPVNANMKAYAAWWLFARLAGWDGN